MREGKVLFILCCKNIWLGSDQRRISFRRYLGLWIRVIRFWILLTWTPNVASSGCFRIEDHHVQFHVAPNPNSVDAIHMAKRIGKSCKLVSIGTLHK